MESLSLLCDLCVRLRALCVKFGFEKFPGLGFRDSAAGREAYVLGHRVAVWEVLDVYRGAKTIARTADHFSWPEYLVKCALAYPPCP